MEKYEVIGLLGEGSFGRVYKAKQSCSSMTVALKVISKRGRSIKEIKGLRRECEIQRHLHHPNIIQMLDSFETDNEIVVITEFAHRELTVILNKEGYLSEERVQPIVWDLVSALYYLHSHRVLHRDLKPQNILLDSKNTAKLCDFGFARNMSTGTHVLTSIKGTPLYMAPELIEEHPYDHNADLWSLGCIIYELLVGAPPFCTTSILHLIRMIRHEQIQWPTFISENCVSFLKGLLHKNPASRLTWPELLTHHFVENHILLADDTPDMSLTRPMSVNTLQAKEQQRKDCLTQKVQTKPTSSKSAEGVRETTKVPGYKSSANSGPALNTSNTRKKCDSKIDNSIVSDKFLKLAIDDKNIKSEETTETKTRIEKTSGQSQNEDVESSAQLCTVDNAISCNSVDQLDENVNKRLSNNIDTEDTLEPRKLSTNINDMNTPSTIENFNFHEDNQPIESEEWVVFLQRLIEEIIGGEMTSLYEPSITNIIVSPLRNSGATAKVVGYVASLFSLPFVVPGSTDSRMEQIKKIYHDVKLVPNLVYASKLLMKKKQRSSNSNPTTPSPTNTSTQGTTEEYKPIIDLDHEDLQALEYIYLLICHLVYLDVQFLSQFCDSVVILNIYTVLRSLLALVKRKPRIVTDLIAILTHILRKLPENSELVDQVVLTNIEPNVNNEQTLEFVGMLRHSNPIMRERVCYLMQMLSQVTKKTVEAVWNITLKDTIEALVYDSIDNVRNAAEIATDELKLLPFYNKFDNGASQ